MPDSIPETGDVVIHSSGSHETQSFAIRAVPGPDQFGCATRGEAERLARTCASALASTCGFQKARAASRCWLAFEEQHVNSPDERAQRMVHSLGESHPPRREQWNGRPSTMG